MKFYKYCGAGNDFILVENFDGALTDLPALAKRLCRRRFSVGADGLIVVERAEHGGDCKMRFFNCDGSPAEMCGNGARCLCRFCHDRGLSGQTQRIESPSGLVTGVCLDEATYRIALAAPQNVRLGLTVSGIRCDYLELGAGGIPHAVARADLTQRRDRLRELALTLRHAPEFPRGANVDLYQPLFRGEARLLTFERGVEDFTLSCGTGAAATAAALTLRGELADGQELRLAADGGVLTAALCAGGTELYLTGPADFVFAGELP